MPDHADTPIARFGVLLPPGKVGSFVPDTGYIGYGHAGAEGLGNGHVHRMVLVIAGHLLDEDPAAGVLEDDEVPDQVQEPPLVEDALQDDLQLRQGGVGQGLAFDGPPGHEPFLVGRQGPDPGLNAVGDDHGFVERKKRRDLLLVGLKLVEGRPDRGAFGGGVLQLDHRERQAVDEQNDVGPPFMLILHDRELIDCHELIGIRVFIVQDADEIAADGAIRALILHRHALDEILVDGMVVGDEGWRIRPGQLAECLFQGIGRHLRVQPLKGLPQPPLQNDLSVILPLGLHLAGGDLQPRQDRVVKAFQPGQGRLLDDGFGEIVCAH